MYMYINLFYIEQIIQAVYDKYLRNKKHVLCFYWVIETHSVKVWENEKCCGNTSRKRVFVFSQLFLVQNTPRREKEKQLVNFDHQNVNSLCLGHHYVKSSCSESQTQKRLVFETLPCRINVEIPLFIKAGLWFSHLCNSIFITDMTSGSDGC